MTTTTVWPDGQNVGSGWDFGSGSAWTELDPSTASAMSITNSQFGYGNVSNTGPQFSFSNFTLPANNTVTSVTVFTNIQIAYPPQGYVLIYTPWGYYPLGSGGANWNTYQVFDGVSQTSMDSVGINVGWQMAGDVTMSVYELNVQWNYEPLPVPTAVTPSTGTISTSVPLLSGNHGAMSINHNVGLEWQFAKDSGFTTGVFTVRTATSGSGTQGSQVPQANHLTNGTWFMRCHSYDASGAFSAYSATQTLTVVTQPVAAAIQPAGSAIVRNTTNNVINVSWTAAMTSQSTTDHQTAYQIQFWKTSNKAGTLVTGSKITSISLTSTITLPDATWTDNAGAVGLGWAVRLYDEDDEVGPYSADALFTSQGPIINPLCPSNWLNCFPAIRDTGVWYAAPIDISSATNSDISNIDWTVTLNSGTIIVQTSMDYGATWQTATKNAAIPNFTTTTPFPSTLRVRVAFIGSPTYSVLTNMTINAGSDLLIDGIKVRWAYNPPDPMSGSVEKAVVRRTGEMTTRGKDPRWFDLYNFRFLPFVEILHPTLLTWVRFNLGFFFNTLPSVSDDGTATTATYQLADRTYRYASRPLTQPVVVPTGTAGVQWVRDRLRSMGEPVNRTFIGPAQSVYTGADPSSNQTTGANSEVGVALTTGQACTLGSVRIYNTGTLTKTGRVVKIWDATGTQIFSQAIPNTLTAGWNTVTLVPAQALASSSTYRIAYTVANGASAYSQTPAVLPMQTGDFNLSGVTITAEGTAPALSPGTTAFNGVDPQVAHQLNTVTTTSDQFFDVNEAELDVMNTVLQSVGNTQLIVDEDINWLTYVASDLTSRASEWSYTNATTVLIPASVEPDLADIPNKIVFTPRSGGPSLPTEGNGMRTKTNQSTGPSSIDLRGETILRTMQVDAQNQTALDLIAASESQRIFNGGGMTINFQAGINPLHSDQDVITLEKPRLGITPSTWVVTSWEVDLGSTGDSAWTTAITASRRVTIT